MLNRQAIRPISITLAVIGGLLVLFAVVYVSMRATQLPAFMPGHLARHVGRGGHVIQTHAHTKLGIALLIAGVAALIGAWWLAFRYEPVD